MAQGQAQFHRPLGVTLLAVGSGLAALAEIWRMLVFLGVVKFTFVGKEVSYPSAQWGQAFWALIIAAIWIWVAMGFWNVRAYAVQFGIFISLFTLFFGFMALLFGSVDGGRERAVAARRRDPAVPVLPGRAAAVHGARALVDDARPASRVRADAGGQRRDGAGERAGPSPGGCASGSSSRGARSCAGSRRPPTDPPAPAG